MFSNEMKEIKKKVSCWFRQPIPKVLSKPTKKVLIIFFAALLVVGITPIAFSKGFGSHDGDHREGSGSHDGGTKVGSSYSNPDMMLVFAIAVIGGAICIVGAIFLVKHIVDKNRTNKRSESPLEYMYQLKPANQFSSLRSKLLSERTGLKLKSSQRRLTRGITPLE